MKKKKTRCLFLFKFRSSASFLKDIAFHPCHHALSCGFNVDKVPQNYSYILASLCCYKFFIPGHSGHKIYFPEKFLWLLALSSYTLLLLEIVFLYISSNLVDNSPRMRRWGITPLGEFNRIVELLYQVFSERPSGSCCPTQKVL